MTTLLRLLFPRTYRRELLRFARKMRAAGWYEGVMYAQALEQRHQPQRDSGGRFAGRKK